MNLEENNGRTLRNLFSNFEYGTVAQLFLHSGNIDVPFCDNFYCITDFDIINSFLKFKKPGNIISGNYLHQESDKENEIYGKYSFKTKYIRFLRDCAWGVGTWKTKQLKDWLVSYNPDVIFFYASDCVFSQRIANWVQQFLSVPMVMYWVDDYYLKLKHSINVIETINQSRYKRIVKKNVDNSLVLCITPTMARDYKKRFGKDCFVLFNTTTNSPFEDRKPNMPLTLSYLGNISLGRYNSIITIGKVISENKLPILFNVYSAEYRQDILDKIKGKPGFVFHGKVSYDSVQRIMEESDILLHVEDFNKENVEFCRYSLSTKIADSLISNRCLLCYGPTTVASLEYLKSVECTLIANTENELIRVLKDICNHPDELQIFAKKALEVANSNHSLSSNSKKIKSYLEMTLK